MMVDSFGFSSQVNRSRRISQEDENMGQPLNSEVERFLQSLNDADREEATNQDEPQETIDVYFVRREEGIAPQGDIVDAASVPVQSTQGPSAWVTVAVLFFCLSLPISAILFQVYFMLNPPVAVVTLVPETKTVSYDGMLPLGRLTHAVTLYQSQTVSTTGRGHQDARAATGTLTFYNASFSAQVVSAGSVFVGSDGTQIQTDTTVSIPANN